MTPIRKRRKELEKQRALAYAEWKRLIKELDQLQVECTHPKLKKFTTYQGYKGAACDDCGYQT